MRVSGKLAWMLFVLLVVVLEVSDRAVASGQTFRSLMKKSSSGGGNSSSGLGQSSETVLSSVPRVPTTVESAPQEKKMSENMPEKLPDVATVEATTVESAPQEKKMSEKLPATVENVSTSRYCVACPACQGPDFERQMSSGVPASWIDGGT
eukprot:GHVS01035813.1.p1 GENE.GHVS01035813.1~~GHVS01035813.1.p1  ORF type:complete len:151 (+),score=32.62 GHVS01035813.1:79-531(+)